jgi:hypothetical protein
MRSLIGLFGAFTALIIVAMVARYGYATADSQVDGLIAAFLFGTIAAGGLGGHAVAARLWRTHRLASIIVGVIAAAALIVNLSNSVGAIAGRSDKVLSERLQAAEIARDARSTMTRLQRERDAIPAGTPTTQQMVQAAQEAVTAAERFRTIECEKRGPLCRQRETDETTARSAHASAVAGHAMTERAKQLEKELAAARQKLEAAPAITSANPQAALLARVFHLPDVTVAATWQQVSIAVVVEMLIVGALMAFELLGRAHPINRPINAAITTPLPSEQPTPAAQPLMIAEVVETPTPAAPRPARIAKPRIVSSTTQTTDAATTMVSALLTDLLEPGTRRDRAALEDVYRAYAAECRTRNFQPLPPNDFLDPVHAFCKACGIATSVSNQSIHLLGVTIAAKPEAQVA